MAKTRAKSSLSPAEAKEISWMDFNGRVLEEAADPAVPLLERLKFLGIYSNNLDEFFRVRVATLNRLAATPKKKAISLIGRDPKRILERVQRQVMEQRDRFDAIYRKLLKELAVQGIYIRNERELTPAQAQFVTEYFNQVVRPKLFPIMLGRTGNFPELRDKSVYLAVTLSRARSKQPPDHALIEVPTDLLSRFILLPQFGKRTCIIMLDDVIRYNLNLIFAPFGYTRCAAYMVKLTRDAELDIDDDILESYVRKIRKSLRQRKEGRPVRLVCDSKIPPEFLKLLSKRIELRRGDPLITGGRYHNFKDFMKFPSVGKPSLRYTNSEPIPHRTLVSHRSALDAIESRDIMLHFPYQSFDYIIDLLREASIDPYVTSIKITLYRTAANSSVVNALMNAVKNGKTVVAMVELQARFEEEANIRWATELQEAGARVLFGVPDLKVHAKLCLITRKNGRGLSRYAVVGTGNFNEDTSRVYTDHFLLTADPKITSQAADVFEFLEKNYKVSPFRHLIVSPFNSRRRWTQLIQREVDNAASGKEAWILLKLNHLTDLPMIKLLYKASQAGVKIRLIIRGMFTLEPGVPGLSENIEAVRLVDKYLEHSRVMFFANGGAEKCFISSADWMPRNLDRRVEVACPILDEGLKQELREILEIQWRDNVKSVPFGPVVRPKNGTSRPKHRAQAEIHAYIQERNA